MATLDRTDRLILRSLALGCSDRLIADDVHLAADKVGHRVVRLMRLLGARNRPHLVVLALAAAHLDLADLVQLFV